MLEEISDILTDVQNELDDIIDDIIDGGQTDTPDDRDKTDDGNGETDREAEPN